MKCLSLAQVLAKMVRGYVDIYYKTDADLEADKELQAWRQDHYTNRKVFWLTGVNLDLFGFASCFIMWEL